MSSWSSKEIEKAQRILGKYTREGYQEALREIRKSTGKDVTADALSGAFARRGIPSPTTFCQDEDDEQEVLDSPLKASTQKLFDLTKKGPVKFSDLCDKLNLPPSKTKALIEEAREQGLRLHVEHDHVGIKNETPSEEIQVIGVKPTVGRRQKIGVISDTHLGSKYCLREQLKDFVHYAYEQGVREILHPGDVVDGMYRHGMWEVSHSGVEAQAQDLFEVLPQLPGLSYRCITGNHDFTFTESSGVEMGPFLTSYFKDRGRNDLHFYGNRSAFLRVGGALVHLWHPRSGVSYARSYALQKNIEKYSSIKPQIMLAGHWLVYCHVFERGIHGIACPTFQGGGSAFSKSLGGAPAIGGMILSWDLTAHGTIRNFIHEYRAYYEREKQVVVTNDLDAIPV